MLKLSTLEFLDQLASSLEKQGNFDAAQEIEKSMEKIAGIRLFDLDMEISDQELDEYLQSLGMDPITTGADDRLSFARELAENKLRHLSPPGPISLPEKKFKLVPDREFPTFKNLLASTAMTKTASKIKRVDAPDEDHYEESESILVKRNGVTVAVSLSDIDKFVEDQLQRKLQDRVFADLDALPGKIDESDYIHAANFLADEMIQAQHIQASNSKATDDLSLEEKSKLRMCLECNNVYGIHEFEGPSSICSVCSGKEVTAAKEKYDFVKVRASGQKPFIINGELFGVDEYEVGNRLAQEIKAGTLDWRDVSFEMRDKTTSKIAHEKYHEKHKNKKLSKTAQKTVQAEGTLLSSFDLFKDFDLTNEEIQLVLRALKLKMPASDFVNAFVNMLVKHGGVHADEEFLKATDQRGEMLYQIYQMLKGSNEPFL